MTGDDVGSPEQPVDGHRRHSQLALLLFRQRKQVKVLDRRIEALDPPGDLKLQASGGLTEIGGTLTTPSQPCFLAFNSAEDSNVTGNGTTVTVDFDSEVFDQGADFSADTFTAPVTSRYHLNTNVQLIGMTAVVADQVILTIVTSNRTYRGTRFDLTNGLPTIIGLTLSVIADMDSGDTAIVQVVVSGEVSDVVDVEGNASIALTSFSGCLAS